MYAKLALRNVKKSYKEYLIYFLTLMFSVCLFYTFNSFQAQQEMMILKESQSTMMSTVSSFMMILSVFVIGILAFLILYANRFLIKQRKKEFGLYMLMGMENRRISQILMYETFLIGLLSLLCGLGLGLVLSQGLALFTANLMDVEVSFNFIFSKSAMVASILAFSGIFFVLMFMNTKVMCKQNLIDLLMANKHQEKQRIHSLTISVVLFVIAIVLLAISYTLATTSILTFATFFQVIIICGIIGTLLFFFSLSGFLLRFIQSNKRMYFRNLNMFVLRSIHERINTNFLSMSMVSLMLLLSIGALATCWNLNAGMKQSFEQTTPYDITIFMQGDHTMDSLTLEQNSVSFQQRIQLYESDLTLNELIGINENQTYDSVKDEHISVLPYSKYVEFCERKGKIPSTLDADKYMLFTQLSSFEDIIQENIESEKVISMGAYTLTPVAQEELFFMPYTATSGGVFAGIIVQDSRMLEDMPITSSMLNIDLREGIEQEKFIQELSNQMMQDENWSISSRDEIAEGILNSSVLFTYIGLYLGIVFLISSAVVLALQQLSQAQENRQRYIILRKIGAEQKLLNSSVFQQLAIYFLLPLSLASVHAYFGIKAVSFSFAMVFGTENLLSSSLITGGIIIAIYGLYFLITYQSYKRILYGS